MKPLWDYPDALEWLKFKKRFTTKFWWAWKVGTPLDASGVGKLVQPLCKTLVVKVDLWP